MANWYVEAKIIAREKPEINELLFKYERLPKGAERLELAEKIKTLINPEAPEGLKKVIINNEPIKHDDTNIYLPLDTTGEWNIENYHTKDEYGELIGKSQKYSLELENSRKKYESQREYDIFMNNLWILSKLRFAAQQKIMDINKEEKRKALMSGEIPMLARKRNAFMNLIKAGYSITNAVNHPNMGNLKKEELPKIVDENTINALNNVKKGWADMYYRWCEKYLDIKQESDNIEEK